LGERTMDKLKARSISRWENRRVEILIKEKKCQKGEGQTKVRIT